MKITAHTPREFADALKASEAAPNFGSATPARLLRTASLTACTALR